MSTPAPSVVRVLIVEDEQIVADDLEASLRGLGFEVVAIVDDANQAIDIASRERPDIILMDIQLHGRAAGIEAAETMRRNWDLPVVFLTAFTDDYTLQQARSAKAYGFLSKPFRIEDLHATIRIALEQHRLGRALFAEHNWLVTMMASLSDGVIATDPSGKVRYINPVAERSIRCSFSQALGRPIEEIYRISHLDGTAVHISQLRLAISAQKPVPPQRFLVHVGLDSAFPVEDSSAPIFEEGHLLGAVTVFADITNRLQAEADQQMEQRRLRTQVQVQSAALGQTQEEMRSLSTRLITAQEDERRRVARELHDDLGQRVALMSWQISKLTDLLGESVEAIEELEQLQRNMDLLSTSLRKVSHQLHPAVIAELGLAIALEQIADRQRAQGMDITCIARDIPTDIPAKVSTALYRIAQEALRNTSQHAPDAPVLMRLISSGSNLQLYIEDPGPGFDLEEVRRKGGLGLLSIHERARMLGGSLEIKTAPGEGTTLLINVPLPQ